MGRLPKKKKPLGNLQIFFTSHRCCDAPPTFSEAVLANLGGNWLTWADLPVMQLTWALRAIKALSLSISHHLVSTLTCSTTHIHTLLALRVFTLRYCLMLDLDQFD